MQRLYMFILTGIFITVLFFDTPAQKNMNEKIKLFVDCSNSFCDMNFIKTQVPFVDYVLDNQAADIHLLITQQNNGGGANHYQLIFYGQNRFRHSDTLQYSTQPNNTDFENRDLMVKYIQLGLIPYITKTSSIENLTIQLKEQALANRLHIANLVVNFRNSHTYFHAASFHDWVRARHSRMRAIRELRSVRVNFHSNGCAMVS